jgi:hypothetical protein
VSAVPAGLVTDDASDLAQTATATFSVDRTYRYHLHRGWGDGPSCVFLMLNPSTADAFVLDPTVTRCVRFAKRWGAGSLTVLNIFALRSTDPRGLYSHPDPVGPANDAVIREHTTGAGLVIAAWGVHGAHLDRAAAVARALAAAGVNLQCLGVTKDGHPRHPLYVKGGTPLTPVPHLQDVAS